MKRNTDLEMIVCRFDFWQAAAVPITSSGIDQPLVWRERADNGSADTPRSTDGAGRAHEINQLKTGFGSRASVNLQVTLHKASLFAVYH
jgi:hypothetical protein